MSFGSQLRDFVVRAILKATDDSKRMRKLQAAFFGDELQDGIEHFEPYGFSSRANPGSEALVVSLDGDRSHSIAAIVTDRRYRPKNMSVGEVIVFDDLGRKIYIKRGSVEIDAVSAPINIKTTGTVTIDAPTTHITGDVQIDGDLSITGTTNSTGDVTGSGTSLHTHTHGGVEPGSGSTGQPN